MKLTALVVFSSVLVLASCAGAPPKSYYNRRAYPPPKYFYGHKGGYNAGPPINKYRPPGFRSTRNPYIGPGPSQGLHHVGMPQSIQQGPPQVLYQTAPQGLSQVIHQGVPQGIPQGIIQQGIPQPIHPGIPQTVPLGIPQPLQQGPPQSLHQIPQGLPQVIRHVQPQGAPHPGHSYQQIPQQSQVFQSPPPKRLTPTPPTPSKTGAVPQFTSVAPWKNQPSHLNSIKNDFNNAAPSFTAATKAYYKPSDDRSPIHTIPAPNLSPADKPADFDYRMQQQAAQQQIAKQKQQLAKQQQQQAAQQQAAQKQAAQQQAAQQQAAQQQAAQQQAAQQQAAQQQAAQQQAAHQQAAHQQAAQQHAAHQHAAHQQAQQSTQNQYTQQQFTQQPFSTTPGFKTLDKSIANQIKINSAALLAQQAQSHFAPDPDPQHVPQVRIPPTSDPYSQPSNGQVPIDIYLQQQVDNEIAQQEALYIEQQRAQEARQYQQQVEAAQIVAAQEQAYQAHQENLKQQIFQQQALEAQQQLAIQAQQQAMLQQQAVLQQQQQYQQVPVQQQPSESLTAEELFNLMNGIPPNTQPSTQSIQNVLATPQQQSEIASAATTNFQPNYQSFNYDEKTHQQERQVNQEQNVKANEVKRASESSSQANFNPQYENFNYDEKTKRNGFNHDNSDVEQTKVDDVVQTNVKTESKDKKDKRYQKTAYSANHGYTVGYSTLPKEITENVPQNHYNNHQQSGYSTQQINYSEKTNLNLSPSRKVKPDGLGINEIKKQHSTHLKKKVKLPNNGYSTIAEDLLQQHDLKKDLQQLTYSTLPNKKILEVLKHHRHFNASHQTQDSQTVTTEKDSLQKMRENAQKFYSPHILQAARNNTSNGNVQIQQSIQIYENNYASKGDDNHIDLSGITTTSTTTVPSTTVSTTEPPVVTEINVIESNNDSDHQESSLYEEIMLQDESKPLEDTYHSNSHSYFGQRIRPKRT